MKYKKFLDVFLVAAVVIALAGFNHFSSSDSAVSIGRLCFKHDWTSATCRAPKTCRNCNKTEGSPVNHNFSAPTCITAATCQYCGLCNGEPLGHDFPNSCTGTVKCNRCSSLSVRFGHTWTSATCTEPSTCITCGETQGSALGHKWSGASCTNPGKCTVCGAAGTTSSGHTWVEATCTSPKTCNSCGITEGEKGSHSWKAATCTKPKTCKVCGKTKGDASGHTLGKWKTVTQANETTIGKDVRKCTTCKKEVKSRTYYADYFGPFGSAKDITGKTLIIGILVSDANYSWNFPLTGNQLDRYNTMCQRFDIGLSWLQDEIRSYGNDCEFIWDLSLGQTKNALCYAGSTNRDISDVATLNGWHALNEIVPDTIDTQKLMRHYKADNVIFAVFLDAPKSDNYRSYAMCSNGIDLDDSQYSYEGAVFVPYGQGVENTPAVYAHEIMHDFGAVDLYKSNNYIPKSYVDYLTRNNTRELMNACFWSAYDSVTTPLSALDAYYVGLSDYHPDVEKYGLTPSDYVTFHH